MVKECKTSECIETQTQISNIQNNANEFSRLQNDINTNYDKTNGLLNNYNYNINDLAPSGSGSDFYKFNNPNSYIPKKYTITENYKPDDNINDGIQRDLDQLVFQQNSIYILGTITAASLLIAGIFLAR